MLLITGSPSSPGGVFTNHGRLEQDGAEGGEGKRREQEVN